MKRYYKYIIIVCLCIISFACKKSVYFEKYQTIDNPWDKNKEYFFICEMEDLFASYNLSLQIRNNNLYPYRNLWLFYTIESPEGSVLRDTVECLLADGYGKWMGSGISIYHLNIPIRTGYTFPRKGPYTFTVRQGMRDEQLKGIEQIGIKIEKNN